MPNNAYRPSREAILAREAVEEYTRASEALLTLRSQRSVPPGIPLVVTENDTELREAIERINRARSTAMTATALLHAKNMA